MNMKTGIIINGVEYIYLMNDNDLKKKSLYDNVYFTVIDIFYNAYSGSLVTHAKYIKEQLYKYKLNDKNFLESLKNWFKNFTISYFHFEEPEEDEEIDMKEYMKFNDWWVQFEELRKLIDEQYETV